MDELTPQERAVIVALDIIANGGTNNKRVREITGISSRQGALRLLCMLARQVIPLGYDKSQNWWYIFAGDNTTLSPP